MMQDKLVAITGPNRGLGEKLVECFWLAGYDLLLIGRDFNAISQQVDDLPLRESQSVKYLLSDFSDPRQVEMAATKLKFEYPKLYALINNAATQGPIGPFWENDFVDWQSSLQVNLLAPVTLCKAVVPNMIENFDGVILNISGGGATGPRANFSSYATAKAGLVRFSETLADETRRFGIRVNCIAPGAMKTNMLGEVIKRGLLAAGNKEYEIAMKVFSDGGASMDLVAQLALFISSPAGNEISGKLISAVWDNWKDWPKHIKELADSDAYTLRRITGRDRGFEWGDR